MSHILFRVRGIPIQSYTAFLYLGVTFGVMAGATAGAARGLDPLRHYVATLLLTIPALMGSRLLFVLTHWSLYRDRPSRIWSKGDGGAMLYGGLLLSVALSFPLLRSLELPAGEFWDAGMVAFLVGMVFTRIGCTLHGCCAGRCTTGWLALELRNDRGVKCRRIPTQLIEAALAASLLVLAFVWRNRPFGGSFFLAALAIYAAVRIPLTLLREKSDRRGGIDVPIAISVALIAVSAVTALILQG